MPEELKEVISKQLNKEVRDKARLNGEIINQGKLMGGENIISVLKGIYIVKVKNYIKKVIVLQDFSVK